MKAPRKPVGGQVLETTHNGEGVGVGEGACAKALGCYWTWWV